MIFEAMDGVYHRGGLTESPCKFFPETPLFFLFNESLIIELRWD